MGASGKRNTNMCAVMHCSDEQTKPNDTSTQEGRDRANALAMKANRFIDNQFRSGKKDDQIVSGAIQFAQIRGW